MAAPASFAPFIPWARFALTGKPFTPLANDAEFRETVAFVGRSAFAELLAELPAACRDGFGAYTVDSDDAKAFQEAVGAKIACRFLASDAGTDYVRNITEVKTADVTEKFEVGAKDKLIGICETAAQKAINRLSCVVEANRSAAPVSLVAFAGRERSCRDYGRVYGERERY